MDTFVGEDEFFFMACDLGKKTDRGVLPKAKSIQEIAITNPIDNDTAYAYAAFANVNALKFKKRGF